MAMTPEAEQGLTISCNFGARTFFDCTTDCGHVQDHHPVNDTIDPSSVG